VYFFVGHGVYIACFECQYCKLSKIQFLDDICCKSSLNVVELAKLFSGYKVRVLMQGAPESVLDRCQYVRVGTGRVPMTTSIKAEIMKEVRHYGTGDCCLSLLCAVMLNDFFH